MEEVDTRKKNSVTWRLKYLEDFPLFLLSNNVYLLFEGVQSLHVDLQFLPQLFKSPWPVLMLPVSVLNGLTQHLDTRHITVNEPSN